MSRNAHSNASHKQILKSTGIIGAEQFIIVLASVLRSKVIALLLGPVGVGIAGLYQSAMDIVRSATGFGLGFSAVRDVAESAATGDEKAVSRTVIILRRWVWVTGMLGMLVTIIFSRFLSRISFGDNDHYWQFILLSATILIMAVSAGQLALLQGLRKIALMAKANVVAVVGGVLVAIPLYWLFGNQGIVFAMVGVSVFALGASWFYARKIRISDVNVSLGETFFSGLSMVKLGFFIVLTGFLSTGTMYAVRLFIEKKLDLDSVGQFQAAWAISTIYLATILNAMGADYFPRLSSMHDQPERVNTLVNEQSEVALLIAAPIITVMIAFSPMLVNLLYSGKFNETVPILQWQVIGTFIKMIAWPIGYIFLATKKTTQYVIVEIAWNLSYFFGIVEGWKIFGIQVTGISFAFSYVLVLILNFVLARSLTGFAWSARNMLLILLFGGIIGITFIVSKTLHGPGSLVINSGICIFCGIISVNFLKKIVDFPSVFRKLAGSVAAR